MQGTFLQFQTLSSEEKKKKFYYIINISEMRNVWGTMPTAEEPSETLHSHGHILAMNTCGFFHPDASYLKAEAGCMATPSCFIRLKCSLSLQMYPQKPTAPF